jgi:hypothetical protein
VPSGRSTGNLRKEPFHGIVQRHHTLLNQLNQHDRRERLGDRSGSIDHVGRCRNPVRDIRPSERVLPDQFVSNYDGGGDAADPVFRDIGGQLRLEPGDGSLELAVLTLRQLRRKENRGKQRQDGEHHCREPEWLDASGRTDICWHHH